MGPVDSLPLDETMGNRVGPESGADSRDVRRRFRYELIVILFAAAVFLGCIVSPPSLMDDVDAVQAQIARNMLDSGDWVTAHLDGVPYLEKSPLKYWLIAVSYAIFGVHDWAARLPVALFTVILCWLTARIGSWAVSDRAGLWAGLALSTCVGLFLFTRVLIPDAILTLAVTLAIWSFLRALEPDEEHPARWAALMAASIAVGLLLKGLIAAVVPIGAALVYLAFTRQLFLRRTWQRLHPFYGALIVIAIAAPWHVLATIRNPPIFYWSLHSGPGEYHGFFWFYFMNEHVLRFLNLRYPRDYNTVPRLWFWLLNLVWIFPWSVYLAATRTLSFQADSRAGRARLMVLCWMGTVMLFFTFSTTQEYYSMPIYPAVALLVGSALSSGNRWVPICTRALLAIFALIFVGLSAILLLVWRQPAPGNIGGALTQHSDLYTLSLGHMRDLTLRAFAYLKAPLGLAAFAFGAGASGLFASRSNLRRTVLVVAASMIF